MTDALERLIEAVERGYPPDVLDHSHAISARYIQPIMNAYHDDMTAALSLLAAILPDHDWGRAPGGQMWVQRPPAAPVWSGDGYPPARGLLLAILRAYAGERVRETADR